MKPAQVRTFRPPLTVAFITLFYSAAVGVPLAVLVGVIAPGNPIAVGALIGLVLIVALRAMRVSLTLSDEGLLVRNGLLSHQVPWVEITGFETAWEILEPRGLFTLGGVLYVHRRGKKRLMIEAFVRSKEGGELERAVKSAAQKHGVPLRGDFAWT